MGAGRYDGLKSLGGGVTGFPDYNDKAWRLYEEQEESKPLIETTAALRANLLRKCNYGP